MNTCNIFIELRGACALGLLAVVLAGCGDSAPARDADQAPVAPVNSTPASMDPGPANDTSGAPAPPAPVAPSAPEPSAASSPVVMAHQPALDSMTSARGPAKAGVPVDLKYSFDSDPLTNQPVTLHLAAVPRVAGTNLAVSVKPVKGVRIAAGGALSVQKASANGAYRQQFSVTREAAAPAELRVLVTMDVPEGSGFGFFSIPLEAEKSATKLDLVKQH